MKLHLTSHLRSMNQLHTFFFQNSASSIVLVLQKFQKLYNCHDMLAICTKTFHKIHRTNVTWFCPLSLSFSCTSFASAFLTDNFFPLSKILNRQFPPLELIIFQICNTNRYLFKLYNWWLPFPVRTQRRKGTNNQRKKMYSHNMDQLEGSKSCNHYWLKGQRSIRIEIYQTKTWLKPHFKRPTKLTHPGIKMKAIL